MAAAIAWGRNDRDALDAWFDVGTSLEPGDYTWYDEKVNWLQARWFGSDIFFSLMTMGVVMLPVLFGVMGRDLKRGYQTGGGARPASGSQASVVMLALWMFWALIPGVLISAIMASVAIRFLGWIAGALAFAAVIYAIGLRPGGLFHRHFRYVIHGVPFLAAPAAHAVIQNGANAIDLLGQYEDPTVSASSLTPVYTKSGANDRPNKLGFNLASNLNSLVADTNRRLFVTDATNNRVLVYNLTSTGAFIKRRMRSKSSARN